MTTFIAGQRVEVPQSSGAEPPVTLAPVGATDCHIHIFNPLFPRVIGKVAPDSTVEDLLLLRRRLGLSRTVVVHPSTYGDDNRALFDALERLGETARGVA